MVSHARRTAEENSVACLTHKGMGIGAEEKTDRSSCRRSSPANRAKVNKEAAVALSYAVSHSGSVVPDYEIEKEAMGQ